jgi:hypothetical protein
VQLFDDLVADAELPAPTAARVPALTAAAAAGLALTMLLLGARLARRTSLPCRVAPETAG